MASKMSVTSKAHVIPLLLTTYKWERVKRIFNILSDRVETVTPWLARKILSNTKNGVTIAWLTKSKLLGRFLSAPFHKRSVFI